MSSLQQLLAEDGFRLPKRHQPLSLNHHHPLPLFICHDRKSIDNSSIATTTRRSSSKRTDSRSGDNNNNNNDNAEPPTVIIDDPTVDEVAARAVVSILAGYVGRFSRDSAFRAKVREKCESCMARPRRESAHAAIANTELAIESIERLAEDPGTSKESKIRSLRNSIRLLSIVASLKNNGYTCGVPNSHLSACAHLYLSIVYKIEKNDRVSARHLLQVFCDSPFLARRNLMPDLWEHFFLPHLLHLKVWYQKEVEFVSGAAEDGVGGVEKERMMKALNRVYNDQMDAGTAQFAAYYKEWLKTGAKAPNVPSVSVPARPGYGFLGKRSVSSLNLPSFNKNLYRAVFGPSFEQESEEGVERENRIGNLTTVSEDLETEKEVGGEEKQLKQRNSVHRDSGLRRRSSSHLNETPRTAQLEPTHHKSDYLRFFSCRNEQLGCAVRRGLVPVKQEQMMPKEPDTNAHPMNLGRAITLISSSDSLKECEASIRIIARAWMDSHGDSIIETSLSSSSVIEGLLEVSFISKDDEVLELSISILAELIARNEINRQIVLNVDPQLEVFMKLLTNNNLYLKVAVLLYLLKPKAKQMLSLDWVPLVLRVLEFGDQAQTLFTIQCSPKSAAFYFLDQLITGFDVDRNVENAKQVVSLGGLRLLVRRLETGDTQQRKRAASLLCICIRADGSCRQYLAVNIKKASILELLLGNQIRSNGCTISLLAELICLSRRSQITKFLTGLKNEGCFNTMHILLVYLQQAPPEQRPLVAAILLQLDLLGDTSQYSVYREEGMDALVSALENNSNKKVQERSSKALLLLGGRFSSTGQPLSESWLLKQAGLDDTFTELSAIGAPKTEREEKESEDWMRKVTNVLLNSGSKRLLLALSKRVEDGTPRLVRACLVTITWMSASIASSRDANVRSLACLVIMPRLLESLNCDRALEERVLASLSLLSLVRNPECYSKLFPLRKESIAFLKDLARITWTAKELLSLATIGSTSSFNG
ncbi:putative E3 ubiquitin-protein ligase LIN [Acorus calamus]|uniref:E3 ubiquitin-protein ligase LIN n=1 Tax=Acorus calamus TaxID=4465 RepID=A0AAV9C632_ACOCL|nr:putative E3 ubiquitin-protein ligase LIN [Acorus calamus]